MSSIFYYIFESDVLFGCYWNIIIGLPGTPLSGVDMGEAMKEEKVIENLRSVVFKESESLEGTRAKIQGYDFNHGINYTELLKSLVSTGFQASNLGDAIETVNQMVSSLCSTLLYSTEHFECVVFLFMNSCMLCCAV